MTILTDVTMNAAFKDTSLSFDPPLMEETDGISVRPGIKAMASGDLVLTIRAPKGSAVSAIPQGGASIPFVEDPPSVFTAIFTHDANFTGPRAINVYVDNALTVHPSLPIMWSNNRPCNMVEVPDKSSSYLQLSDVPHGTISREIYWSRAVSEWRRCIIYTPPGYHKTSREYPVLYLLNGFSDNELSWVYQGKLPYILDNLLAGGHIEPFVVVMNNGMTRYRGQKPYIIDDAFQRMLTEDCIPFIANTYRVKFGKWNRAIAGLSMGAYMTNDIGLKFPELFGYIGTFTASMTHETLTMTYERPYKTVMKPGSFPLDAYRVFFRSTTPAEDHLEYFEADDAICERAGVTDMEGYRRILYPPETSKWNSWRRGIHDFSQLLFVRS